MARTNSVSVWGVLIFVVLVVGGCSKLIDAIFGDRDDPAQAALTASKPLPQLIGMTLVEAENQAEALDLRLTDSGIGGVGYCSDKTTCTVFRMSPKAGAIVKAGDKVAVTFITAEEKAWYAKHATMPKAVGWSETKSDAFFEPIQDALDSDSKQTRKVPYGKYRVIAQSPKPGSPLRLGQKIKIVIGYNYDSADAPDSGVDININNNDGGGESRYCSRRWWC